MLPTIACICSCAPVPSKEIVPRIFVLLAFCHFLLYLNGGHSNIETTRFYVKGVTGAMKREVLHKLSDKMIVPSLRGDVVFKLCQ